MTSKQRIDALIEDIAECEEADWDGGQLRDESIQTIRELIDENERLQANIEKLRKFCSLHTAIINEGSFTQHGMELLKKLELLKDSQK